MSERPIRAGPEGDRIAWLRPSLVILPLAKLLGAHRDAVRCCNTSGGFLSTPLPEVLRNVEALLERGIGGIKLKVGQPDAMEDWKRVQAVHKLIDGRVELAIEDAPARPARAGPQAARAGAALDGAQRRDRAPALSAMR